MSLERLPILMQDGPDDPAESKAADDAVFIGSPVIAIYDAPGVARGDNARFRVVALDAPSGTVFTISAQTLDGTATESTGDYSGLNSEFTFTDEGEILVPTGGTPEDFTEEFAVEIEAVSAVFVVRNRATATILQQRGASEYRVYEEPVYEAGVYLVIIN